jgi:hypothetical protein
VTTKSAPYAGEVNGLGDFAKEYHDIDRSLTLHWDDPRLARITRLRLLSDPGFPYWDISYCHGETKDGVACTVTLPFDQLPKRGYKHAIVTAAQKDKVYAKGLGIFDAISTLI